jgi:hypothetical protein
MGIGTGLPILALQASNLIGLRALQAQAKEQGAVAALRPATGKSGDLDASEARDWQAITLRGGNRYHVPLLPDDRATRR